MRISDWSSDVCSSDLWIGKRDTAVLLLLYGCGLRVGEALSLTRGMAPRPGPEALLVTGKGNKQRMVPLLPAVTAAIVEHLSDCHFAHQTEAALFLAKRGGPQTARRVKQRKPDRRATPGLPQRETQHDTKHTSPHPPTAPERKP